MALFGLVFLVVALILIGVGIVLGLVLCGIAAIPAGMLCAWLAHSLFEAYGSGWLVFLYGALGGALGGIIIALLVNFIYQRLHTWAAAKLTLATRGRAAIHDV